MDTATAVIVAEVEGDSAAADFVVAEEVSLAEPRLLGCLPAKLGSVPRTTTLLATPQLAEKPQAQAAVEEAVEEAVIQHRSNEQAPGCLNCHQKRRPPV